MIDVLLVLLLPLVLMGQLLRFEPTMGVSLYPHDILIALIGMLVITSVEQRKLFLFIPIFIQKYWKYFLSWMIISLLIQVVLLAESPIIFLYLLRTSVYVTFLSWLFYYLRKADKRVILFYWMSGLLFAIITLGMYLALPDLRALKSLGWDDHYFRAVGPLLDPNFTGSILVVTIISLIGFLGLNFHKHPMIRYGIAGLFGITLAITFSRSSWLSLLIGMSLISIPVIIKLKIQFWRASIIRLIVATLAILVMTLIVIQKPGGEGVNVLRSTSIIARQQHDQSSLKTDPIRLLVGSGLSTSPDTKVSYHARLPNNLGMLLLAFSGIPGIILFIWSLLKTYTLFLVKYPHILIPLATLLLLAQFNAVLTEPFTLLLCGFQLISLTTEKTIITQINV